MIALTYRSPPRSHRVKGPKMSVKKVMMAFSKLAEEGHIADVSIDEILAHDVTGHLARLREDKLVPLISIGATKSGWGLTPRTRTYSKY